MGAKVVTLLLGPQQVAQLHARYPGCVLSDPAGTGQRVQEYRVMVPGRHEGDACYHFLIHLTCGAIESLADQPTTVVGISGPCGPHRAENSVQELAAQIVEKILNSSD